MSNRRDPKILSKRKIRPFAAWLLALSCMDSAAAESVKSLCFMASKYVDYRRATRRYGKRRRDSGMGLKKILVESEQKQLWKYLEERANTGKAADVRDFLIFDILIHTGLRISELCHLRLKDTPGVLGQNALAVYRGKNNKDRDIPISDRLAAAIADYIKKFRQQTLPDGVRNNDTSKLLFYSRVRSGYTAQTLYKRFKKLAKQAGIAKDVHPHMFRHTYITNALLKGVNLGTLKQIAGHSSIKITERYVHLTDMLDRSIGNRLDTCFLNGK